MEVLKTIDAYYERLTVIGELEDMNCTEFAILHADLGSILSQLHENRGDLGEFEFIKYANKIKSLMYIIKSAKTDQIAYYKSIRDVVLDRVSNEDYLEIVTEAKRRINRI